MDQLMYVQKELDLNCPVCGQIVMGRFSVRLGPNGIGPGKPEGDKVSYEISGTVTGLKFDHDCTAPVMRGN